MTDFSKATPRPWKAHSGIVAYGGTSVTYCGNKANAALIVEAVNSYDAMKTRIAELEAALTDHNDMLRSCYQVIARKGTDTNWDGLREMVLVVLTKHHQITNEARAALGKEVAEDD